MSDLDDLMAADPLSLTAENIDSLIAFYRKQRADYAAGVKPKKDRGEVKPLDKVLKKLAFKGSEDADDFDRRV